MREVEVVTNRYLSKEFLKEVLEKNGWSITEDKIQGSELLYAHNKKGEHVLEIYLNELDKLGNEIYEEYEREEIDEIKRDSRFSGFTPYYNIVSYFSDCYDDAVDFLYMLKKEGLIVYFRFCDYGELKELRKQL